jgi:uncharacterized phage protein gp47/JayE
MLLKMLLQKIKQARKKSVQPVIRNYKVGEKVKKSKISKLVKEVLLEYEIATRKL